MKVKVKNGQLSLWSFYKLAVVGWGFGLSGIAVSAFALLAIIAATGGPAYINGEAVHGFVVSPLYHTNFSLFRQGY